MTSYRFGKNHWNEFTKEDQEVIEKERKERLLFLKDKLNLGKKCPACTKPNTVTVNFCTGCKFPLKDGDIVQLPKNIFLDIITGKFKGTEILYRDKDVCLFDDKYGVSDNHLDVIPIIVIKDITLISKKHIPLLKKLYVAGMEEFKKRKKAGKIKHIPEDKMEDYLVVGFNHPVSVPHLHIHMVLPPFRHPKVFQYPRWHKYSKIIEDLEKYDCVKTYDKHPNDEEGKEEYERSMRLHLKAGGKKFDEEKKK